MSRLGLNRKILSDITNGNQEAIKALEQVFSDTNVFLPDQFAAAIGQAAQAVAAANQALGMLVEMATALDQLLYAPAPVPVDQSPEYTPAFQFGSIAVQDAETIDITGGTIGLSAGTVALPSFYLVDRTTGLYRAALDEWRMAIAGVDMITYKAAGLTITKPITSTVAAGTAPFVVASNFVVANLNSSLLLGGTWAIPGAIGATTRNTGAFTTVSASSGATATAADFLSTNTTAYSGSSYNGGMARMLLRGGGATGAASGIQFSQGGSCEAFYGAVQNATGLSEFVWNGYNGAAYVERMRLDSNAGLKVLGAFGCNGKAAQTGAVSGGTLAGVIAALVANGILTS